MRVTTLGFLAASCFLWGVGCGEDKKDTTTGECDPTKEDSGCGDGMLCEETKNGDPQCAAPVEIRGIVVDTSDESPVEGALVQAVDPNGAAVGTSAVSAADGSYVLAVPAVRSADGAPVDTAFTLRAQALPLDTASATDDAGVWVIDNALSTVGLIRLPGVVSATGSISGTVVADSCAGVLVIAERGGEGVPGYSDSSCLYTIFNVTAGTYTVNGYAAGLQLVPATATVADGAAVTGVDLTAASDPLGTVSGNIQFVNASGGSGTSVILAVESTFVEAVAKGEVPPGLRVGNVTGDFTIEDVPDGSYVVLASFENDGLVRDPDESIGGTALLRVEMPDSGGNRTITLDGFKVTGALAVTGPGADTPEAISTETPTFEWADDSSEDGYTVQVFDAFGTEILSDEIPGVSGSATVTYPYAGQAFETGMYYQFKVRSFREKNNQRTYISATEDLRGVFYFSP